MQHFSIKILLYLMTGLIMIALATPLAYVIWHQIKEVNLLQQERMGVTFIPQLQQLNILLAQHRGTNNMFLNGNQKVLPKLQALDQQINHVFLESNHICQQLLNFLPLSCQSLTQIHRNWQQVNQQYPQLSVNQSFKIHTQLIQSIRLFQTDVADVSKLSPNSLLTTYYLMDNTVKTMPDLMEYMGQLRGFGSGVITHGYANESQKIELTKMSLFVRLSMQNMVFELGKVFEHSPKLKQQLKTSIMNTQLLTEQLLNFADDQLIHAPVIQIHDQYFFNQATEVITQINQLYYPVVNALHQELDQQIKIANLHRHLIEFSFIILFIIVIGFISHVNHRINHSLKIATTCFEKIGQGDYDYPIKIKYHDEIGKLLFSLEKMRSRLSDSIEELNQAVNNLSEVQRIAHIGNWNWNLLQNTLIWSEEVYRIFEVEPTNFTPNYQNFLQQIIDKDRLKIQAEIDKALHIPGNYFFDYQIMTPKGKIKIIHQRLETKFNRQGQAIRMIGTVEDITERKQQEKQKRHAEKMAALEQLIAGIAHEINTPLGVIQASTRIMQRFLIHTLTTLPPLIRQLSIEDNQIFSLVLTQALSNNFLTISAKQQRQKRRQLTTELSSHFTNAEGIADTFVDIGLYHPTNKIIDLFKQQNGEALLELAYHLVELQKGMQQIHFATERVTKIVFALKTYTLENTQGEKTAYSITEGIETILTLYQNQFNLGIELIKDYPAHLPEIYGYADELNQVWTHLIFNAIQAMGHQGQLIIKAKVINSYIRVLIQDNGEGIEAKNLPRIFEAFFTTKPTGEGSGLGLHVAKKIIENHQGCIEVNSQSGCTQFWVYLPFK